MDDVSDDDEDLPVAATLDPRFRQGLQATWVSVGNVEKYDACPNEACYMKKLINKSCPSCNTMLSEDDMAAGWTASFGFVIENTSSTRVVKVFTTVMKTVFSKIRPGCTFPDDTDEVEEILFNFIPKPTVIRITAGNVLTDIDIQ